MQILEKTRQEVEEKTNKLSDFLKMEYLENCKKQIKDIEIQKFCRKKLSELYEARKMYPEAARNIASFADSVVKNREKIEAHLKEMELWIKAGFYDSVDITLKKVLAIGNARERTEIKEKVKNMYLSQALVYEKENRNSNALRVYELILSSLEEKEKLEIQKKILVLYNKLGKIREYTLLKELLDSKKVW